MPPTLGQATIPQQDIPALYGRIAWLYDIWASLTETRARHLCLDRARVKDGEAVLEVAVGTGLAYRDLVRLNVSGLTEGVDLTEAMLQRARRRVEGLPGRHRLRVGDAHHLDFPAGQFDLVMNSYMFDLLPDDDFALVLGEFRRVLKPGGRIALVNMAIPERWPARIYQALYRLSPRLLGGCRGVSLGPYLTDAGFLDARTERVSQLWFPSEVVTAHLPH